MMRGQHYRAPIEAALALRWPVKLDYLWQLGGDDGERRENTLVKYSYARQVMLEMGYDALLTIDDDTIVPPSALVKLAEVDADVVYGLYAWRGRYPLWNSLTRLSKRVKRSLSWEEKKARDNWGQAVPCKGIGHGCTLWWRGVLETIPFRNDPDMAYHCDWTFSLDAEEQGFNQMCHTGVVCGHILKERTGLVAWPNIRAPRLYSWAKLIDGPGGRFTDDDAYERNTRAEVVEGSELY